MNINCNGIKPCWFGAWRGLPMIWLAVTDDEPGEWINSFRFDDDPFAEYAKRLIDKAHTDGRSEHVLITGNPCDPIRFLGSSTLFAIACHQYNAESGFVQLHVLTNGEYQMAFKPSSMYITVQPENFLINPGLDFDEIIYPVDHETSPDKIVSNIEKPVWLKPRVTFNTSKEALFYENAVAIALKLDKENVRVLCLE